jgi:hypothetical protein
MNTSVLAGNGPHKYAAGLPTTSDHEYLSPGREWNHGPHKYAAGLPTTQPRRSFTLPCLWFLRLSPG